VSARRHHSPTRSPFPSQERWFRSAVRHHIRRVQSSSVPARGNLTTVSMACDRSGDERTGCFRVCFFAWSSATQSYPTICTSLRGRHSGEASVVCGAVGAGLGFLGSMRLPPAIFMVDNRLARPRGMLGGSRWRPARASLDRRRAVRGSRRTLIGRSIFQLTGKRGSQSRIHHFEQLGWTEPQIVTAFGSSRSCCACGTLHA